MRIRQIRVWLRYYIVRVGGGGWCARPCESQLQILSVVRLYCGNRSDVINAFRSYFLHAVDVDIPDKIKPRFHSVLIIVHVHAIGFLRVNIPDATLPNNTISHVVPAFGDTAT